MAKNNHTDIISIQNASGNGIDIISRAPDGRLVFTEVKTTGVGTVGDLSKRQQDPVAYAAQALGATSVVTEPNIGSGPVAPPSTLGSYPAPTCHHGPKKHKSGQGAKGPWQAWMCPSAKGTPDQCQPMWIKRGEVGWVA